MLLKDKMPSTPNYMQRQMPSTQNYMHGQMSAKVGKGWYLCCNAWICEMPVVAGL